MVIETVKLEKQIRRLGKPRRQGLDAVPALEARPRPLLGLGHTFGRVGETELPVQVAVVGETGPVPVVAFRPQVVAGRLVRPPEAVGLGDDRTPRQGRAIPRHAEGVDVDAGLLDGRVGDVGQARVGGHLVRPPAPAVGHVETVELQDTRDGTPEGDPPVADGRPVVVATGPVAREGDVVAVRHLDTPRVPGLGPRDRRLRGEKGRVLGSGLVEDPVVA